MTIQEFMPHWKDEEKCYEEQKLEMKDSKGKKVFRSWPRDKPVAQIVYERWLEQVTNSKINEYHPARDVNGQPIKGTGAKHLVRTIIRIRRRDGNEFLYSLGEVKGYDGLGDTVIQTCRSPEVWKKTLFDYKTAMNENTRSFERHPLGPSSEEMVYSLPFTEKNLKLLFDKRESDYTLNFVVKDENAGSPVSVRPEPNINDTLKLFLKPFDYLFNGDYISPQQKAELRQQAIDMGAIPASTPSVPQPTAAPPKGTYS